VLRECHEHLKCVDALRDADSVDLVTQIPDVLNLSDVTMLAALRSPTCSPFDLYEAFPHSLGATLQAAVYTLLLFHQRGKEVAPSQQGLSAMQRIAEYVARTWPVCNIHCEAGVSLEGVRARVQAAALALGVEGCGWESLHTADAARQLSALLGLMTHVRDCLCFGEGDVSAALHELDAAYRALAHPSPRDTKIPVLNRHIKDAILPTIQAFSEECRAWYSKCGGATRMCVKEGEVNKAVGDPFDTSNCSVLLLNTICPTPSDLPFDMLRSAARSPSPTVSGNLCSEVRPLDPAGSLSPIVSDKQDKSPGVHRDRGDVATPADCSTRQPPPPLRTSCGAGRPAATMVRPIPKKRTRARNTGGGVRTRHMKRRRSAYRPGILANSQSRRRRTMHVGK
jgi:hypothetical protein